MGGIYQTAALIAERSGTAFAIDPLLVPGVMDESDPPARLRRLLSFPSYGFLFAVAPKNTERVCARFAERDLVAAQVGTVSAGPARISAIHDQQNGPAEGFAAAAADWFFICLTTSIDVPTRSLVMPVVSFQVTLPDGSIERCSSPSRAITEYLDAKEYRIDEFQRAVTAGLEEASNRVQKKFGFACSAAAEQLQIIEQRVAGFAAEETVSVAFL